MASEPSEFGDEAAGDELRGVSAMLRQGVERSVENRAERNGEERSEGK